jgi:uncharacterized C2H2 Zn-finger protein
VKKKEPYGNGAVVMYCPFCGRGFWRLTMYTHHIQREHRDERLEEKPVGESGNGASGV